jgi:hypothetical protein
MHLYLSIYVMFLHFNLLIGAGKSLTSVSVDGIESVVYDKGVSYLLDC